MVIRANIVTSTNNNTVIVDSVEGIVREDIFVSNITLRARNVRVLDTFASNSVVLLTQNVSITTGNVVQFQKLVTGTGLIAGKSQIAYFMRVRPSYDPAIDPRLPKVTKLADPFYGNSTRITLFGNISSTGILPIIIPRTVATGAFGTKFQMQNTSDISVGDIILSNSLSIVNDVRVAWVGNGNAYIGLSKPTGAVAGQVFYVQRPVQPSLRIGSETIYYSNTLVNTNNNTITVTNLTRNIANTRPIDQTVTTLAADSAGTILTLSNTAGVQYLDYVLINNSTLSSNIRVLWTPEGEGNANVGINTGLNVTSSTQVVFQRDWIWPANTTVSILGSIPL
jgi:hypothetical protein